MSAGYLLPAQTLLDLCGDQPSRAKIWAGEVTMSELHVSVVSRAQSLGALDIIPDVPVRTSFIARLERLLADVQADGGVLHDFDLACSRQWRAVIHAAALRDTPRIDQFVYATAIHHGLAVVEEAKPAHEFLRSMGVEVVVV